MVSLLHFFEKPLISMRAIVLALLLLLSFSARAQQPSREALEKRREALMESIQMTQAQLETTKKSQRATLGELRALQIKIRQRQKLIDNINQEINQINQNISETEKEIQRLRSSLKKLELDYARSVRYAYRTRSAHNMLAFLFSADDFNDALRRMRYVKRYQEFRRNQAESIRRTQKELARKMDILGSERAQKDILRTTEELQRETLQKESSETNAVVSELKGREKELTEEIKKSQAIARRLDKTINDLIRREIEIARKKAEEEERKRREAEKAAAEAARKAEEAARSGGVQVVTGSGTIPAVGPPPPRQTPAEQKTPEKEKPAPSEPKPVATAPTPKRATPSYQLSLTPEVAALSNRFEQNRGKLPWPVEKGFVAESFGRHKHAVAEKVTIENNGLDIVTSPGAPARAVFGGEVSAIIFIPGMGQSVLINHGEYFTVYSRLSSVRVSRGQKVETKETIGQVATNEEGVPLLHFELWKVSNNVPAAVDPALWIAR